MANQVGGTTVGPVMERIRIAPARWMAAPLAVLVLLTGCSADDAESIDPETPPSADMSDVTHTLEPTAQMRDAAIQQCLDDPDLAVGYVKAVAPESGAVLSEFEIDCDAARAGG